MPRYFRNRKAEEVKAFLDAHGYKFVASHGDDEIYASENCNITVKLPSRRSEIIPIGTMDNIKKCLRKCGFKNDEILSWWKENGYGD